ncbi:4Fe-4S binding protein [Beijerinckia indica]|uniref:4Fe-4S ferredoxin-type domain-containing protein n=1 Tax=Beijerinckia indica subsp. indica (strain ATCC 9039 / DSM 1715 / NCIMB 8712) TaxID=395963 RepID=B2IE21_BEII9|nr:4Fe-4S binding protein [Beijerinckia indica]ACB94045.1 conserved hypothetical protein [Beijerinckia indica subsp. indica ATCC 9039]
MAASLSSVGSGERRDESTLSPSMPPLVRQSFAHGLGEWLRRHQRMIQTTQWGVVLVYLVLVAVPAFLPLPDRTAHVWNNLTVFAQFAFWGLWWPFVLLSMVLVGRTWCGVFCPEGALTEAVSRVGLGLSVPRWIKWKGWPFVAFVCTTVYGQMLSIYQYPMPVLLILGGSTAGAMAVGALYGRNKRVWCRYLCPVNGVFGLLAKLAPVHFKVDQDAWADSQKNGDAGIRALNCAPLVPIRTMRGAADCHMCGRCSDFRGAVSYSLRSPAEEIVDVAGQTAKPWETMLIVFGLMGVAVGAFHWTASPWYVDMKEAVATWLIDHSILWPLQIEPPWWILTHYPDLNDSMTLLDGAVLLFYIFATALVLGGAISLCLAVGTLCLGGWSSARFHHLAQSLVPMAGCGVFLGLSATTVTLLKAEGITIASLSLLRGGLLLGAFLWVVWLAFAISGRETGHIIRRMGATLALAGAAGVGVASWVVMFWIW